MVGLIPRTSFARGDPRLGKLVAGIDPSLVDQFLPQRVRPSRAAKGDGSIRLRFLRKGEQATFKLDARDLIWDYEAVNREPGFKLFSLAKPGEYELRFHMWWENGACDSAPSSLKVAGEAGK